MSTSINKVSYKPLGGSLKFAEWFLRAFADNEVDYRKDLFYISSECFEEEISKMKTFFVLENAGIIGNIRRELKKEKGSCDFSIDW